MNADNKQDQITLPKVSWWLNLTREQLHEAVEREAARMRHSKVGGSMYGQGPGVIVDVIRNGFNRGRL